MHTMIEILLSPPEILQQMNMNKLKYRSSDVPGSVAS